MRNLIDLVKESEEQEDDLFADDKTTEESWGTISLPVKLRRVDTMSYVSRGRGGTVPARKVRALLTVGTILVGGYEWVKGTNKVIVFDAQRNRYPVTTEEEAQDLLATWIGSDRKNWT